MDTGLDFLGRWLSFASHICQLPLCPNIETTSIDTLALLLDDPEHTS